MKWFGNPGGAAYESDCPKVPVPVGAPCLWCDEPIAAADDGVVLPLLDATAVKEAVFHYECHLRQIVGGLNHLRGRCTCCGGTEPPDPAWLTRRQAAVQAVKVWQEQQASGL